MWSQLWKPWRRPMGRRPAAAQRACSHEGTQQRAHIEELEPRLLYSADNPFAAVSAALLPAAVVQVVPAATPHLQTVAAVQAVQAAPTPPVAPSRELVFIDAGVAPTQALIDSLLAARPAGVQVSVVMLQAGSDGLQQVSDTLARHQNLTAVHIVAHGEQAALQLGSTRLDAATLAARSAQLQTWGAALTADADLLLYGCDVAAGEAGAAFIQRLAALTGADVAASTNATGAAALGGDWLLEAQVGDVTAQAAPLPLQQAYTGLLGLVPSGGEVRVNSNATGNQLTSVNSYGGGNVAVDAAGNAVVVWNDLRTNAGDIYFQRYDAAGLAQGGNVLVNSTFANSQDDANVAMDASGNFVVVWSSDLQDGSNWGIYGQRFDASGNTLGSEFQIHTTTTQSQLHAAVAMAASGEFVVAWADVSSGDYNVKAQRYNAAGAAQGGEIAVNTTGAGEQRFVSVAIATGGAFVVTWQGDQSGNDNIYGQRFDAAGALLGAEFQLNTYSTSNQHHVAVAGDSAGNFVAVWESAGQDPGGTAGVYGQRYNAAGVAQGGEFRVNSTTTNAQTTPAVAMNATGGFVVSWTSGGGLDGSGDGVYAQAYDAAGAPLGGELRVATSSSGDQQFPAVAHTGSRAIVAWSGNGSGDPQGVFAQAFQVTAANQVVVDSAGDVADGDTSSIDALVGDKGADGVISLREAITAANNTSNGAEADRIVFNIAGTGTHIFTPGTALPTITDPLRIDGSTESDWVAGSFLPIVLDGNDLAGNGLNFSAAAAGSSLRGLVVRDFGGYGVLAQSGASGLLLAGNFIGAHNSDGSAAAGSEANASGGAALLGDNNTVGGLTVAERNVFGGNGIRGLVVVGDGNTVQGNLFGVAADGSTVNRNTSSNLHITGSNNLVGGTSAAAANVLANSNSWHGINLTSGAGNSFLGNTTYGNALLGIDLGDNGVTANDAGDADTGANNLQNFPLLAIASTDGAGALVLAGSLDSTANSHFRIEFFANTSQDSSGFGESQTYLGFVNVSTDGAGNASFSPTLAASVPVGTFISATATRSNAAFNAFTDTSELARNVATVSSTQAVVTVDTTNDVTDGDTTSISTLLADKGADGYISLREALAAANNTANGSSADRITFNIAGAGVHTLNVSTALPSLTDAVVLDGYSQAGASPNTLAVGSDAVLHIQLRGPGSGGAAFDGLTLGAGSSGSTISGLVVGNFKGAGIEVVSGNNTLTGNWVGLNSAGTAADANVDWGLRVNGSGSNLIGGTTPAARNVFSGNMREGIYLYNGAANTLQGNYIGTNAAGTAALANSAGLQVHSGTGSNQIGGAAAGAGNLISGNTAQGVHLRGGAGGNVLRGNTIGLDATGSVALPNSDGIWLDTGANNNRIGGVNTGDANTIAGNSGTGIVAYLSSGGSASGNALLRNTISGNGGLAIDLSASAVGGDGVTANDNGDADSGANNLQNFPLLAAARTDGSAQLVLTGTLNSQASSNYRVEFFASAAADASGHGEGQRYLGFVNLATDGAGNAAINTTLAAVVAAGETVSATTTRANAGYTVFTDSSEFALNVPATLAPVLGTSGSTLAYAENDAATAVDAALTVTDGDSANLVGATVTVSANYSSGQDVLAFSNQLGISGSWNAGTGVLTLSGVSTVANYQTALRSVSYSNSSDNPSTLLRTVSFVVDDGVAPSAPAARNISVAAVNDAPAITSTGSTLVVAENSAATPADAGLLLSDADHTNLAGATVAITTNYVTGQDLLQFSNQLGISGSWNAGTGVLTLSGTASVANYQTALRTVTYLNSSEAPSTTLRTLSFDATDGLLSSAVATRSLQVNAVNDAPVLDNSAALLLTTIGRTAFTNPGNTVAQVVGSMGGDRITDVDSLALEGVAVTGTSTAGLGNWQYSLDGGTNWIALGGLTSNSAMLLRDSDRVRFVPSGAANGQATLTFRAWDQSSGLPGTLVDASSAGGTLPYSLVFETATVNVVENTGGVVAVDDSAQTQVGVAVPINVTANDLDPQGDPLTVLDVSNPANGTVTVGGGTVTYTPNGGYSGSDSFNYLATDGSEGLAHYWKLDGNATDSVGSSHGTLMNGPTTVAGVYGNALQFDGVNDHVALPDFGYSNEFTLSFRFRVDDNSGNQIQYFYSHGLQPGLGDSNMVHVGLVEASNATVGQRNQIITTVLDGNDGFFWGGGGQLLVNAASVIGDGQWHQYTVTVTPGIGTQVYIDGTLRGSINTGGDATNPGGSAIVGGRSDLDNTRYLNAGTRMDSLAVFNRALDNAEVAAHFGGSSPEGLVTVAVNAAPVVATSGGSNSHTENGTATVLDAGLTVNDANSATLAGATVSISSNYSAGQDQLLFSNQLGINGSWNAGTGQLTLSGTATVANYQAALRSVTYANSSEAPNTAVRGLSFVVSDGLVNSNTATRNLNVAAVNDAPTASNLNAAETYTEDTALNLTDIVVNDVDHGSGSATLTLSNPAAGVLSTGTAGAVTATYNAGTGVWTASGPLTDVNSLLAGVGFTPALNFNSSFSISTSVSDGVAAPVTGSKAFTGVAVNDAPVTNLPGTLNGLEDLPSALTGLSISDPDAGTSVLRAEMSVTGGTLAAASGGGVTVTGSGSGVLVLAGTLADLNNYLAGPARPTYTAAADTSGSFTLDFRAADGVNSGTGGVLAANALDYRFQDGTPPSGPVLAGVATTFTPDQLAIGLTGSSTTFAVTYSGVLNVITTGTYTFTVNADDAASLWLNGSQIAFAFFGGVSVSTPLSAGTHSLELRYSQDSGGAGLGATYAGPDTGAVSTLWLSAPQIGRLVGPTASSTINVAAVNDAPTASNLNAAETYTEDTALNLSDIVAADIDSANITTTLTLSNPAAGVLNTGTAGGVSSSYNAGTGVWTASGALAGVNSLLAALVFTPTADFNGSFAINTSVSDGVAAAITGSKTITGVPVNDAPTASNLNSAETYTEDTLLNLVDIVAADIDNSSGSVTLALSNPAAGMLGTATSGAVSSSYNPATGVWTASGAFADINVLLAALSFTPTPDFNAAFSIITSVSDGAAAPVTGVKTFSGVPVNDAPTASNLNTSETTAEDQPLNLADIVIGDIDSANVTAQLTLSNPTAGALAAATAGSVTASYNAATGVWLASGALADVSTLLQGLVFTPALNFNGTLSLETRVDDGVAAALLGSKSLTVMPVNDAPTASNLNSAETYTEDSPLNLVDIVINDVDHSTGSATLTLSDPTVGVLSTGTSGAVSASYNTATGVWQASGALVDVNTLLASLAFTPAANVNRPFSISTVVSDGVAAPVSGSKLFTALAVNDAPAATNLNAAEAYIEDLPLDLTDIVASDLDSATLTARLTLSNAAAGALSTATSGTVTSSFNPATGVWQASGALADVNALLAAVAFVPAPDFNAGFSISTALDDGTAPALLGSKLFTGTAVNDAPTASGLNSAETYTEDTVQGLSSLVLGDIDSAALQVTLTLSNPAAGTLSTPSAGGVTAAFDANTGSWTASGPTADVNAVLAAVQFTPALNFNGSFNVATAVSDGVAAPVVGSKAYTGVAVNDAPVLAPVGSLQVAEGSLTVLTAAQLQATDVDNSSLQLAYTVVTAPAHGTLLRDGQALATGGTFTQAELDAGRVVYRHDSSETTVDGFDFTLDDGQATAAGGTNGRNGTSGPLPISVTAVNDEVPLIVSPAAGISLAVPENTLAVTRATATDADLPAQTLRFEMAGGADAVFFSIDGSTGELQFISTPDHETPLDADGDNVYRFDLRVSDGTLASMRSVAVTVLPVNDNTPQLVSGGGGAQAVIELQEGNAGVTTVQAQDADRPLQSLSYTIVGGADAARFALDAASGALRFVEAPLAIAPRDSGGDNRYDVVVQASDGSRVVQQALRVQVRAALAPGVPSSPATPTGTASAPPAAYTGGETMNEAAAPQPLLWPDMRPMAASEEETASWATPPAARRGALVRLADSASSRGLDALPAAAFVMSGAESAAAQEAGLVAAGNAHAQGTDTPSLEAALGLPTVDPGLLQARPGGLSLAALAAQTAARSSTAVPGQLMPAPTQGDNDQRNEDGDSAIEALAAPVVAGGLAFSATLLVWATRAGGLAAAMMASVPAWRSLDPLPILERTDKPEDDDEADPRPATAGPAAGAHAEHPFGRPGPAEPGPGQAPARELLEPMETMR